MKKKLNHDQVRKLSDIREIAKAAHAGQKRKGNVSPYLRHLEEVLVKVTEKGADFEEQMLAITHELFDKNPKDIETLKRMILNTLSHNEGKLLISRIEKMTQHPIEDLNTYLRKIATDEKCIRVKIESLENKREEETDYQIQQLNDLSLEFLNEQVTKTRPNPISAGSLSMCSKSHQDFATNRDMKS